MGYDFWVKLAQRPDFIGFITIAPVAAFVTWVHVWMALKMVFYPLTFWGIRLGPLPLGWQGIVPRKAGKIAGVIVDQTLSKLGSLQEFFEAMNPTEMAHILAEKIKPELPALIDDLMLEHQPVVWKNVPYSIKRRVYAQAAIELPALLEGIVVELTFNVEQLVDMRQMIVRQMEDDRALMVRMFLRVGQKEINFIWHISFFIGLFFGIIQMGIWLVVPWHWTIVFWAGLWGLLTNWIAIWMVFNPVNPIDFKAPVLFKRLTHFPFMRPTLPHIGTYRLHGAFMRRQNEVADVFAQITTRELITVERIMQEMMYGEGRERTRRIIRQHIAPVLERPVVRTALAVGLGKSEMTQLKNGIIDQCMNMTMEPMRDPEFNMSRAAKIFDLFRVRIQALTPREFQNLLRPAFHEDEWMLIVLGGITGAIAGYLQYIFGFK